jgi:hypothetical protein
MVEWVGDGGPHLTRQMRVKRCGAETAVAQVLLNDPQIDTRVTMVLPGRNTGLLTSLKGMQKRE